MSNLQYTSRKIRPAAILTNAHVDTLVLWDDDNNRSQELNQSVLFIDFTIGSLTSLELKLEYSDNWVDYYQQTFIDVSGGTATTSLWEYTFTASWAYEIANPFKARFVRASVKGTGTVTSSSCTITWIIWIA